MGKAIGIDLGTTNTVMAIKESGVRVIQNDEPSDLTPSIVSEYKTGIKFGRKAIDVRHLAQKDTIVSIKRLMGRAFRDPEVQAVRGKVAYQIVEPSEGTDDDLRVIMGGKQYSPVQISAMILKKIKEDAEARLNGTVDYAVITVPAYFTEKQKEATRRAGQLAGLKVQKILDEPTAAAISFGVENVGVEEAKTILVYDLGGGTFDVSVMTIVGSGFVQLDIEGDMWLGGDDFDHKIVQHVLQHVSTVLGIDGSQDAKFMLELQVKAEQAKRNLSSFMRTDISVSGVLKDEDGNIVDVEVELTRAEFERMIGPDIQRSIELVKTAIKNAGEAMTSEQIDQVLLVGGSSCIPLVRKSLAEVFGEKKLMMDVDPMRCVAYGASILAAKWAEQVECSRGHVNPGKNTVCDVCQEPLEIAEDGVFIASITPMHYGVQAVGDKFEIVIPKGSTYPTPEPIRERFYTSAANLRRLRVPIYAGFDPVASANDLQAIVWLELPENVPARTPVEIALSLGDDGILEAVHVALLDGSGTKVVSYIDRGDSTRSRLEKKLDHLKKKKDQSPGTLDADVAKQWEALYRQATMALNGGNTAEAAKCLEQMEKLLQTDEPSWKRKAQGLCNYTDAVLDYSFLMDPTRTQQLKTLMQKLQGCIDRDDEAAAVDAYEKLDKATDDLPDPVQVMMILNRAVNRAASQNQVVEADQVRVARLEIEAAMRAGEHNRAIDKFNSLDAVFKKIFGSDNKGSNTKIEEGGVEK